MIRSVVLWCPEHRVPQQTEIHCPTYAGAMSKSAGELPLIGILERAQAEGALGARPVAEVIEHARHFVAALPADVGSVLDMGSGAGIPGLVIALDRPNVRVTLVDRRAKRTDALRRAVNALDWSHRVQVVEDDAEAMAQSAAWRHSHDAVVARGFGEPRLTLPLAVVLVRRGGWVVISEPPTTDGSRWEPSWVESLGVGPPERCGAVVRFHVEPPLGESVTQPAGAPPVL